MSRFDKDFGSPMYFEGHYWISRKKYDRAQAALEISAEVCDVIPKSELNKRFCKFGFLSQDIRDEFGITHGWYMCGGHAHGAMPIWEYEQKTP